jgi:hypothetical protein
MFKNLRGVLGAVLLLLVIGTAYSYWYSATHGDVYVNLSQLDERKDRTSGALANATGRFKTASGTSLAEFRSDQTGLVSVIHPEAGDCAFIHPECRFPKSVLLLIWRGLIPDPQSVRSLERQRR